MFRTHFGAFCALTVIIRSILGPFQGISGAMEVPPPFSPSRSPPNPSPALSVGRSTLCTSVISLAAPRAVASLPAALCAVRLGGSVVRAAVVKVTLTGTAAAAAAMAEDIRTKLEHYKTAPFDSRFPNQNQTRNCWQNYLDFHRCEKAMAAKGADATPCQWYYRVYKSICPTSWVTTWDEYREEGTFPGKI